MAVDLVELGTFPNDGTGDDLRTAFEKVNANFSYIDDYITNFLGLQSVSDDPNPTLGGNLNLNNFSLNGLRINEAVSTVTLSAGVKSLNITGTVSSISNHNIGALGNVADTAPTIGQALVWQGSQWAPGDVTAVDFEFINFNGTFTNPIQFLLEQNDLYFGPFIFTSFDTEIELNLGTF